ncbi:hypothetical protein FQA39_LY04544 [Lamprigera yunnana]|nr:hypothetical protein FQA39_LY04544 [Lamprigera yunnana]
MLVQQHSHDSDISHSSDVRSCNWRLETSVGSDTNLCRKRDIGFMRKSTLMRRLWGFQKPLLERSCRFSSYCDWQYAKSNLNSNNSSPEHTKCKCRSINADSKPSLSSQRYKGTKCQSLDLPYVPNTHKLNKQNSLSESIVQSSHIPVKNGSCCSNCTNPLKLDVPTSTETEDYSARNTRTTYNSDSAYTNSHSNLSHSSGRHASFHSNTYSAESLITEAKCKSSTEIKRKLISENCSDSSTQTTNTTNLNVISNLQLSEATLNLIFNEVMRDIEKSPKTNINISTVSTGLTSNLKNPVVLKPQIIQVKQVPSFYLKNDDKSVSKKDQQRKLNYTSSNVVASQSYFESGKIPRDVVPRYSALPRTTSMEVNTSSGESSDRESDNISLVDSLEGSWSHIDVNQNNKFEDRLNKVTTSLLPDNSIKTEKVNEKSSVFFIPIETNNKNVVRSVADHLPDRVRDRLSNRQIKRQQKLREAKDKLASSKSDSNYISASENGNIVQCSVNNNKYSSNSCTSSNSNKIKKKNKPLLPNINQYRKHKNVSKSNARTEGIERYKDRAKGKRKGFSCQEFDAEKCTGFSKMTEVEKLSPLSDRKKNYSYDVIPNKIYHKTKLSNSNKHIEIIEIVDCMGALPDQTSKRSPKVKTSKIPILVQSKLPSISKDLKNQKPTFLDFDQIHKKEPKVDQLIANILIDALNKADLHSPEDKNHLTTSKVEKRPSATQIRQGVKYQQKFEIIPEERTSTKTTSEDPSNSSSENGNEEKHSNEINEQLTTKLDIPNEQQKSSEPNVDTSKHWVTLYAVHKNEESPHRTSDEGKKQQFPRHQYFNKNINTYTPKSQNINQNFNSDRIVSKHTTNNHMDCWSSSDQENQMKALYPLPSIYRNQQRRGRLRNSGSSVANKHSAGEWTVTVSGVTSGKEFAPDLEMRLMFPHNSKSNLSDRSKSEARDVNEKQTFITKRSRTGTTQIGNFRNSRLPDIMKQQPTKLSRNTESIHTVRHLKDGIIEPRQTRTSTRRLVLNRPQTFVVPSNYMEINVEDNNIKDIIKKFPGILKITGNAITPESKPKLTSINERDVTRHLHHNS